MARPNFQSQKRASQGKPDQVAVWRLSGLIPFEVQIGTAKGTKSVLPHLAQSQDQRKTASALEPCAQLEFQSTVDPFPIRCYLLVMSIALTTYWRQYVDQLISSGRYNNQSEVIRAGLRALEEREMAGEVREFEQVFVGGQAGEPDDNTIQRAVARQKSFRKGRR